jgi:hypothetical protein
VITLLFILPILMEGHNVLWGDTAAIATIGAMLVTVLLSFSKISCASLRSGVRDHFGQAFVRLPAT